MFCDNVLYVSIASVLVLSQCVCVISLDSTPLIRSYELLIGRPTACPANIDIRGVSDDGKFVSASLMSANGYPCNGPGGKAVAEGSTLLSTGIELPSLVVDDEVQFFAGLETAPRTCGAWAFNASAVSWFIYKPLGTSPRRDELTGIEVQPGYMYVTYEHFADLCVFRAQVDEGAEPSSPAPSSGTPTRPEEGDSQSGGNTIENDDSESETSAGPDETNGETGTTSVQTPTPADENQKECFPADALVRLEDGSEIPMEELQLGDRVLSSTGGDTSDVYFFSHRDRQVSATFVRLETSSKKFLLLTRGHYLYLNGRASAAGTARPGDYLTVANGTKERLESVKMVNGRGLYNPHTSTGDIIVNSFLTTTWTTAISPEFAHPLLTPFRFCHSLMQALTEGTSG